MEPIMVVAGGLLATMLVVGGIVYLAFGGDIDFQWESQTERES